MYLAGSWSVSSLTSLRDSLRCVGAGVEVASSTEGLDSGLHVKSDYDGLQFQAVSGDEEFLPGVTVIQAP